MSQSSLPDVSTDRHGFGDPSTYSRLAILLGVSLVFFGRNREMYGPKAINQIVTGYAAIRSIIPRPMPKDLCEAKHNSAASARLLKISMERRMDSGRVSTPPSTRIARLPIAIARKLQ